MRVDRRNLLRGGGFAAAASLLPSSISLLNAQTGTRSPAPTTKTVERIKAGKGVAVVETKYGKLAGYVERDVFVFKGIPYGKSTGGAGRFMAPQSPAPWSGIRSTRAWGPQAPQAYRSIWENDEEGFLFQWERGYANEDCLRLNVWTPSLNGKARAVMVYFHGGGYAVGSAQELKMFDGINLALHGDVVLVTVNHRLNVLGYLNLSAYGERFAESANAGSLDTKEALVWVRDNISQFGGNPSSVTIFGQSGGGGKVATLLAMPSAQGLFHKAVMESGPTIRIGTEDGSRELTDRIMKRLGVSSASINKLEDIPYDQLEHAASAEMAGPRAAGPRNPFRDMGRGLSLGPVMDGKVVAQNPFDPDAPPSANNIPLLIGTTLNEFTNGINHPDAFDLTDTQLQAQVENSFPGHGAELIASYRELYPNANPFQLWSIISTASVRDASLEVARIKSKQSASVYCYQFAWQTPVLDGRPMAFHCSELPFVFDNAALCEHMTGGGEASHALAERVSRSWINFAKHGDPSHGGIPRWNRFTTSAKTTMVFDDHCRAVDNLDTKQLDLVRRSYART